MNAIRSICSLDGRTPLKRLEAGSIPAWTSNSTQTKMDTDKAREKEIQMLCKQVLSMSADCYESGGGTGYTRCPLCCEEVRIWQGGMNDIVHDSNCGYLIAKGLATNGE